MNNSSHYPDRLNDVQRGAGRRPKKNFEVEVEGRVGLEYKPGRPQSINFATQLFSGRLACTLAAGLTDELGYLHGLCELSDADTQKRR